MSRARPTRSNPVRRSNAPSSISSTERGAVRTHGERTNKTGGTDIGGIWRSCARRWTGQRTSTPIGGATFSMISAIASTRLRTDCRLGRIRLRLPHHSDRQQRRGASSQRYPEIGDAERRSEQVAEAGDEQCRALRREGAAEGAEKERVGRVRSTGQERSAPRPASEGIKELRRDEA